MYVFSSDTVKTDYLKVQKWYVFVSYFTFFMQLQKLLFV